MEGFIDTYAAIPLVVLWDRGLAHGSRIYGEVSLLKEGLNFLFDTVPNRASVDKDNNITLRLVDQLDDLVQDERFRLGVVLWRLEVQWCQKTLARNLDVHDIRGKHQVYWTRFDDAIGDDSVNFCGSRGHLDDVCVGLDELL